MDRIKTLNEALWRDVPQNVIAEAEDAAEESPVWIARRDNGHIVAMDGPGDPEIATGAAGGVTSSVIDDRRF